MHATRTRPQDVVSAVGDGVVSHAGSRLLADLADQTTLPGQLSAVFTHRTAPQTAHDPGRVLTDQAVMIAAGGERISDIATLADQPGVFGPVGSDSTCWRVLDSTAVAELTGLLPTGMCADYPAGMQIIVRRERPHPGGQLDLIEEADGWRYTCFATDTPYR